MGQYEEEVGEGDRTRMAFVMLHRDTFFFLLHTRGDADEKDKYEMRMRWDRMGFYGVRMV